MLHKVLGYALCYLTGKWLKMSLAKRKAVAPEAGMQNSGVSTSLAAASFPNLAMATVPGAIFSLSHFISGAIPANNFNSLQEEKAATPER